MAEQVTPASVFKKQENVDAAKYRRDITRARAEGVAEGRTQARSEVVDFLQKEYLDPKVERGTEHAQGILDLTRRLMDFMMGKADHR